MSYGYDTAGRLDTITIARGVTNFDYSPTTGNVETITAPDAGTLDYTYDGTLPLSTTWAGTINGSVSQTYNTDLRVATQSVNTANTVSFTYDNDGLLTNAGSATLTRDPQNGLITEDDVVDTTETLGYNDFAEVDTAIFKHEGTEFFNASYTRDNLGRITDKTETIYGTATTYAYTYDTAGRLTNVTKNSANLSTYIYDDIGVGNSNRTSYTDETTGVTTRGTYDNQDRLTSYGANTYTYNNAGDLETKVTASGTNTYTYDELGNLTAVTLSDGRTIDYIIDGQNRRVGKKINGTLTQGFLYNGNLQIIAELDASGNIVSRFVYGSKVNVPDYMVQGATIYRIVSDNLGSARLVINADTGDLMQQIEYDEFGRVLSDSRPGFQAFGLASSTLAFYF